MTLEHRGGYRDEFYFKSDIVNVTEQAPLFAGFIKSKVNRKGNFTQTAKTGITGSI